MVQRKKEWYTSNLYVTFPTQLVPCSQLFEFFLVFPTFAAEHWIALE